MDASEISPREGQECSGRSESDQRVLTDGGDEFTTVGFETPRWTKEAIREIAFERSSVDENVTMSAVFREAVIYYLWEEHGYERGRPEEEEEDQDASGLTKIEEEDDDGDDGLDEAREYLRRTREARGSESW